MQISQCNWTWDLVNKIFISVPRLSVHIRKNVLRLLNNAAGVWLVRSIMVSRIHVLFWNSKLFMYLRKPFTIWKSYLLLVCCTVELLWYLYVQKFVLCYVKRSRTLALAGDLSSFSVDQLKKWITFIIKRYQYWTIPPYLYHQNFQFRFILQRFVSQKIYDDKWRVVIIMTTF